VPSEALTPLTPRASAAILLLILGISSLPAQQKPSREQELSALRAEIGRLTSRLAEVRRRQSGLEGELQTVDVELRLQEAALYRLGRQGYLRLFLSVKPDRRLLPSIRLMRYLAHRDRAAVERYQRAKDDLAGERQRLLVQRREAETWIRDERARRQQLMAARGRKAALLARVEGERRALAARTTELADRERRLASFLDFLYGRATSSPAGTPMQQFRGVLDWPAEGRVTSGFGSILDPRYRTRVPHNGVDLAVAPGAEVKAVFPGKVLFAAPFQGYGNTVVVQHPGRIFTLYAGLAAMRVGMEDMVSLGDAVGLAAEKLYFEIRVENRPEDPLVWLR
jgi:septal ring factor EnvC (AmiA/AmiB activator)